MSLVQIYKIKNIAHTNKKRPTIIYRAIEEF